MLDTSQLESFPPEERADIIAEMRQLVHGVPPNNFFVTCRKINQWADRLDTASSTRDAFLCGLLRRLLPYAERVRDGLFNLAAMNGQLPQDLLRIHELTQLIIDADTALRLSSSKRETVASRETQSAVHNEASVCQTAHNAAKLRAAVEGIEMLLGAGGDLDRKELAEECARALTAPPRNCDKLATNADEAISALKQRFPAEECFAGFEVAAKWLYDTQDYCLGVVVDRPFGLSAEGGDR